MKRTSSYLLALVLLSHCWSAQAQTTPASQPKTQSVKPLPRPKGAAAPKRKAYTPPFTTDTAAFRRSGRPADRVPTKPLPAPPKN